MILLKSLLIVLILTTYANSEDGKSVTPPVNTSPETFNLPPKLQGFCYELSRKFEEYKWGHPHCENFKWQNVRKTSKGTPLIWTTFGEEKTEAAKNTTLVLCGVHGDEITPVKFCWDLINELKKNKSYTDKMVVVAPLVTPDSFFIKKPTRTNAAGVDVNRNFPTKDWKTHAHKKWRDRYKKDKRKFPGHKAASEQETIFQMNLIKRYRPNKVITVHAPLTILDYDGPSLKAEEGKSAEQLLDQMSQKSSGYKVSNYPIFPGSLGNWAGKDNHIPTYTLELPNSNPKETDRFWGLFKEAVLYAVDHKMGPTSD